MEGYKIKKAIIILILLMGCATKQPIHNKEVILKFKSEIPIKVTIQNNNCKGNWNFCDTGSNWNFKKWRD